MTPHDTSHDTPRDHDSGHLPEERLVDLVLGEAPAPDERDHLDGCADCGSLRDSLEHTLAVAKDSSEVALVPPPPEVWARIESEVTGVRPAPASGRGEGEVLPLTSSTRTRRRVRAAWLAAACAAGVLIGVGGSVVADHLGRPGSEPGSTLARAQLDTLDTEETRGSAAVQEREGQVFLEVSAEDIDASGGYAEVWLINRDGERMVSVGVLDDPSGSASFPISRTLLDEGYVVVDISREAFDDKPQHSGDSFVRGPLTEEA